MKISYEWLSDYLDLSKISPQELAEKMSRTGIEVESVEVPGQDLSKLVVGLTLTVQDHPDSDHLHLVTVQVGPDQILPIVCGAPNVAEGQKVIVALHGARIHGGHKIKKGKIRGYESAGMICSLQELGYPSNLVPKAYEEGIYVFQDPTIEVGMNVVQALALDSVIIDLDLTANRSDALSVRGAVHEIAAIYGLDHSLSPDQAFSSDQSQIPGWISLSREEEEAVPAYHMWIIDGVTIKESPQWLQNRLVASGVRPINNVVDVTNYILMEYGQPLHAFDYDKLGSKQIHIRKAARDESLTTLDGIERKLDGELVITNGNKALALAGVMGGLDSEITSQTKTIALEAALFAPGLIRQASQKHHLRSESSARFEKGINHSTVAQAGQAAADLILQVAGGQLVDKFASLGGQVADRPVLTINLDRINGKLGTQLTENQVMAIWKNLQFPASCQDQVFSVTVPSHRWDIAIEADLIEEVGRIYGYDKLPTTLPYSAATLGGLTPKQAFVRWTRRCLQGLGLSQALTYALTTEEKSKWFTLGQEESIALDLPMSSERTHLRQSLIPSLLEAAQYNKARSQKDLAFYEIGKVFTQKGPDQYVEKEVVAGLLLGLQANKSWNQAGQNYDFFALKGILEAYFHQLGMDNQVIWQAKEDLEQMHPGQTATILLGDQEVGFMGRVHPQVTQSLDLGDTFVFQLDLESLLCNMNAERPLEPIGKYPSTSRDIALLLPKAIHHGQVVATIRAHGGPYLKQVTLFDLYQGQGIAPDMQSLAYNLLFQNPEATLTEEEVRLAMEEISKALTSMEGVSIR